MTIMDKYKKRINLLFDKYIELIYKITFYEQSIKTLTNENLCHQQLLKTLFDDSCASIAAILSDNDKKSISYNSITDIFENRNNLVEIKKYYENKNYNPSVSFSDKISSKRKVDFIKAEAKLQKELQLDRVTNWIDEIQSDVILLKNDPDVANIKSYRDKALSHFEIQGGKNFSPKDFELSKDTPIRVFKKLRQPFIRLSLLFNSSDWDFTIIENDYMNESEAFFSSLEKANIVK